jgi:hypothetical protein
MPNLGLASSRTAIPRGIASYESTSSHKKLPLVKLFFRVWVSYFTKMHHSRLRKARLGVTSVGLWIAAHIIIVRIDLSAIPLWWCTLTLENFMVKFNLSKSCLIFSFTRFNWFFTSSNPSWAKIHRRPSNSQWTWPALKQYQCSFGKLVVGRENRGPLVICDRCNWC